MTSAIRTARNLTEAKKTGAHFTPPALADYVAQRIISALPNDSFCNNLEVLDPSCGDGELLRAFIEAVPEDERRLVKLVGIEDNDAALAATKERLDRDHAFYELLHADFLQVSEGFAELPSLDGVLFDSNVPPQLSQPDVIIANPPYVRTQVLGSDRAQQLAVRFQLRGRVDLYHAFLIAMTDVLRPGGVLGVITSNRFLTTRSGISIRSFLRERYDLIEIIDLGDTKLFSAAVLPAIVIARKRLPGADSRVGTRFKRIYEDHAPAEERHLRCGSVFEALESGLDGGYQLNGHVYNVTSGTLGFGSEMNEPWRMTSVDETAWTEHVERTSVVRIADLTKVRVGIKTTADAVFIRNDWESLAPTERPEAELLRPILTHFDAEPWRANKSKSELFRILYTHEVVDGRRRPIDFGKYPRAWSYLQANRERLEGRTFVIEAGRHWYEIWVPQDPAAWSQPKVVFPDISVEPRFFYDDSGALVNGDCYWFTLPESQLDILHLIQGCANSTLMMKYHDLAFQNKLYSGRRRFISQFVERYPIPDPRSKVAKDIVRNVRELLAASPGERVALEERLNRLVAHAFNADLP